MRYLISKEEEVEESVKSLMKELTTPPYTVVALRLQGGDYSAIDKLMSQGYVEHPNPGHSGRNRIRLTPAGWEYWERLRLGGTKYWVKKNLISMLAVAIATGSLIVSVFALIED